MSRERKTLPGRMTLNVAEDRIRFELKDARSRIMVAESVLTPSHFTRLLSGEASVDVLYTPGNYLEHLGDERIGMNLIVPLPGINMAAHTREKVESEALKGAQEMADPGWHLSDYLGSKDSFFYQEVDGVDTLHARVRAWTWRK